MVQQIRVSWALPQDDRLFQEERCHNVPFSIIKDLLVISSFNFICF